MKKLGLLFVIFILSACTAKYDVIRHDDKQLSINDSYYISTPKDGKYNGENYINSGEMTRDALFNELHKDEQLSRKTTLLKPGDDLRSAGSGKQFLHH